jgi:hypothetical protein
VDVQFLQYPADGRGEICEQLIHHILFPYPGEVMFSLCFGPRFVGGYGKKTELIWGSKVVEIRF